MSVTQTQAKTGTIAIDVQGVGLCAGGKKIVHAISFSIKRGEFIGIIGPNGSGKTSLMTLLAGVKRPHEGAVFLEKTPLVKLPRRIILPLARLLNWVAFHISPPSPLGGKKMKELLERLLFRLTC